MFRWLNIQILAQWLSVPSRGGLPRVWIAKGSLFAGLAFARMPVTALILKIRKSNRVCCPGWSESSESQWQAADLPYSVQEWNAHPVHWASVLLPKCNLFVQGIGWPLTWYFGSRNASFCKTQQVKRTFFLTRNGWCAFLTHYGNQFHLVMLTHCSEKTWWAINAFDITPPRRLTRIAYSALSRQPQTVQNQQWHLLVFWY
jgi:hypothetical protein